MQHPKQFSTGVKEPLISEAPAALYGGIDMDNLPPRKVGMITGGVRNGDLQIVARKHAIERIHSHGQKDPLIEVCGVLTGNVYRDDMGPYLHINDIVQGLAAPGGAGPVSFTPETWSHIYRIMDKDFPHLRIVGWYHTHPGHGIFLSEVDLFLHDNFFDLPWQAALVHDPQSGQDGIFGWQNGAIRRSNYLIETDAPAPVMVPVSDVPQACVIETPEVAEPEPAPVVMPVPVILPDPVVMPVAVVTPPPPVIMPAPDVMPAPMIMPEPMMEMEPEIAPVMEMIQPTMKPLPAKPKAHSYGMQTTLKVALALVGLALFVITGLLAGLLIQQFHLTLPHWPNTKWPG